MVPPEQAVLDEASKLINGDRHEQYGDAVEDFSVVAEYWTVYLRSKGLLKEGVKLIHKDTALMMTLLKVRREGTHPKTDNNVDGVGYLALAEKCERALDDAEAEAGDAEAIAYLRGELGVVDVVENNVKPVTLSEIADEIKSIVLHSQQYELNGEEEFGHPDHEELGYPVD